MFDLSTLEAALAHTIFSGNLHFAPVTDSTNNDALTAARAGAPHGSVWFADEQSAGRGRGGNAWRSAAGEGLYVSVLLRLPIPTARLLLLPLAAGLAAADAVRAVSGIEIDLRWPNDLLIGHNKTGGILVEAGSEPNSDLNSGAFAVVPGTHVPAVGYVRQEPAGAQGRGAVRRHGQGRGGEPGRVSRRGA